MFIRILLCVLIEYKEISVLTVGFLFGSIDLFYPSLYHPLEHGIRPKAGRTILFINYNLIANIINFEIKNYLFQSKYIIEIYFLFHSLLFLQIRHEHGMTHDIVTSHWK